MKKYLRPIFTVILLVLVFKLGFIKWSELKSALTNPTIVIAGIFFFIAQFVVFAYRWHSIVALEKKPIFKHSLQQTLIGNFFNFFIPSGVGGDVIKAWELSRQSGLSKQLSFSLVTVDRVLGLFSLIAFSAVFLAVEQWTAQIATAPQFEQLTKISAGLFLVASLGLFVFKKWKNLFPNLKKLFKWPWLHKIFDFFATLQKNLDHSLEFSSLNKIILISFIAQCLSIGFLYLICYTLTGQSVSIFLFFPLACFAFMASAIPITPAGLGVGQYAFHTLFLFISPEVATACTTAISLMQLFTLIVSLPGGYFFSSVRHRIETTSP